MNKGGFLDDTFEKALEAGQSMAKSGAKQIKQTFNPLQMLKNANGSEKAPGENGKMGEQVEKMGKDAKNNTPLDFDKLQKSYGQQDEAKAKAYANRLFQMVKSGEERVILEKKQKEDQQKQQEQLMQEEKKRKERERQTAAAAEAPKGKERQSILGGKKKKANPSPTEIKPSQGKQ